MTMPIRARKNQYRGVNAHLHSYFQAEGGWKEFHTALIHNTAALLKQMLFPLGYTVGIEDSLQIRTYGNLTAQPEADVIIYDADMRRSEKLTPATPQAGALVLPASQVLAIPAEDISQYKAAAIYEYQSARSDRGVMLVWIEILSPTNKSPGQRAADYQARRTRLLGSGVVFVEIDYLHETAPMIAGVADYRTRTGHAAEQGAHPYRIAMIVPRPDLLAGQAYIFEFDVDMSIPTITLPLSGDESVDFDPNSAYEKACDELLFAQEFVDYAQLPRNFDRYTHADQTRIAARMLAIKAAAARGDDLETGPFDVAEIMLEAALNQLKL